MYGDLLLVLLIIVITNRAYSDITFQIFKIISKANTFATNIWEVILNLYRSWKDKHLQPSMSADSVKLVVNRSSKVNQCKTARWYDQTHMQKLNYVRLLIIIKKAI